MKVNINKTKTIIGGQCRIVVELSLAEVLVK